MVQGLGITEESVFVSGKIAMHYGLNDLSFRFGEAIGDKFKWTVAPTPTGPAGRFQFSGGSAWCIPATSTQKDLAYELITAIPGLSCVKPQAALYMFPRLDPVVYPIEDDRQFFLELLRETRVMLVQGTGFNWSASDHFRIVFLPHEDDLREAIGRVARFLAGYRKRHGT
jgi:ABC-type glycerol-3-phosphate transport system substrate-binding protein